MRCTGKEQLTCNEEKMGCEGCFYAKEEASIQEDIKILEKLANRTCKIDKDGWETAVCSIDEQLAIRNIIARNKKLEKQMGKDLDVVYLQGVHNERDRWKSKIKEKIEKLDKKKRKSQIEYSTIDELIFDKKIEVSQEILQEGDK